MNDAAVGGGEQVLHEHLLGRALALELLQQERLLLHARTTVVAFDAVAAGQLDAAPANLVVEPPPGKTVDEEDEENDHEYEADREANDHAGRFHIGRRVVGRLAARVLLQ